MYKHKKGESKGYLDLIIIVILAIALLPVVKIFIGNASSSQYCVGAYNYNETARNCYLIANSSITTTATSSFNATELVMIGLVGLFVVIAIVALVARRVKK